jgi:hypothetical protein
MSASEKLATLDDWLPLYSNQNEPALWKLRQQLPQIVAVIERYERVLFLAEHLFQMVPPEAWRESGGDDGQGHYEGDYHAIQLQAELKEYRAALAALEGALT